MYPLLSLHITCLVRNPAPHVPDLGLHSDNLPVTHDNFPLGTLGLLGLVTFFGGCAKKLSVNTCLI